MECTTPMGYHGIMCKRTFKTIFKVKEGIFNYTVGSVDCGMALTHSFFGFKI